MQYTETLNCRLRQYEVGGGNADQRARYDRGSLHRRRAALQIPYLEKCVTRFGVYQRSPRFQAVQLAPCLMQQAVESSQSLFLASFGEQRELAPACIVSTQSRADGFARMIRSAQAISSSSQFRASSMRVRCSSSREIP